MLKRYWFFLLILTGCYYEPEQESFTNVPQQDYSRVSINLNEPLDTIYISVFTSLNYTLETDGLVLVGSNVYIGDKLIQTSSGGGKTGIFYVNPTDFESGKYTLKLELIIQSGTGSLADKLGVEYYTETRLYPIEIASDPPEKRIITEIDTLNGTLKISWDKYDMWNFQSYTITKQCSKDGHSFTTCDYFVITDNNISQWQDNNFVGGYVKYRVDIKASDFMIYGDEFSYNWIPKSGFELINNRINFTWEPPLFYNNLKGVSLREQNSFFQPWDPQITSFDLTEPPILGKPSLVTVRFESLSPNQSFDFNITGYLGELHEFPAWMPILYNRKEKVYYSSVLSLNGGMIMTMDESYNVLSTYYQNGQPFDMALSENGEYVMVYKYIDGKAVLYRANPLTLAVEQQVDLDASYFLSSITVSNNGIVAMATSEGPKVFDWENEIMLFETPGFSVTLCTVSQDGKFIVANNEVWTNDSGVLLKKGVISIDNLSLALFAADNTLMISKLGENSTGKLEFWDVQLMIIKNSISLPQYANRALYDPLSNYFVVIDYLNNNYLINPLASEVSFICNDLFRITIANSILYAPSDFYSFYSYPIE